MTRDKRDRKDPRMGIKAGRSFLIKNLASALSMGSARKFSSPPYKKP
jgi:hypothetical protein